MRIRPALTAALTGFLAASPVVAQTPCCDGNPAVPVSHPDSLVPVPGGSSSLFPPPGSSSAVSPTREALERINLRSEWTAYIPMDGRSDGLGPVQVVDGGQIFVQTRAGRLIALDAATGAMQWSFRYPKEYANLFPVGLTERLVFAVNVNTLYCFSRYSGLQEFSYDLPGIRFPGNGGPTAGPVADERNVYLILGSTRIAAYSYPEMLTAPVEGPPPLGPDGRPLPPDGKAPGLAEQVAGRYAGRTKLQYGSDPNAFDRIPRQPDLDVSGSGVGPNQLTPSMSSLTRIAPPYTLRRLVETPSVAVVASMRQPYSLRPPHVQYNQQTPSISVLSGSVARATILSNLRPGTLEPNGIWHVASQGRTLYQPIQTPSEVWFTTDGPLAYSLSKANGALQGRLNTASRLSAPAAGPVALADDTLLGFFAQQDGTVVAVDLPGGSRLQPKIEWQSNVGGYLNHKPVPTRGGVYASGDNAGVARIDLQTGEVMWRTEATADQLLAVNDEFAYVRDRRGNLLVYPRALPNNPSAPLARPVAQLPLRDFNVPVTNGVTDRILMGADNGVLICLRDSSAKYTRPARVAPPARKVPEPKKTDAPPPEEPKKDM